MVMSPQGFGPFGNALLVGNFGDGKINAFTATGNLMGTLMNASNHQPISMPGLWSLNFGSGVRNEDPGTLYFTAGIGGTQDNSPVETHGLLGSIQAEPVFPMSGVQNGASFASGAIAPNTWITLKGSGLAPTTANWQVTGNVLPTQVGGVGVTVNGEAAPVSYVSNMQINFLVPSDIPVGTAQLQTTNNGLSSATVAVPVQAATPAFFTIGTNSSNGNNYIAATHADGSLIGPSAVITGATAAKPGETIVLYGTGFGATVPSGRTLQINPAIVIGGVAVTPVFAGMVSPGLYQFNVVVPQQAANGDVVVTALLGNSQTQAGTVITVGQ
jgi:uncharacterized protein (TIGR03437 family)